MASSTPPSYKTLGNEAFARQDFAAADELYTRALVEVMVRDGEVVVEEEPRGEGKRGYDREAAAILHANKAAALMGLKRYAAALEEAETCVRMCPAYSKGYFRKAQALEAMARHIEARRAYEACLNAEQKDEKVRAGVRAKIAQIAPLAERDDAAPALQRIAEHVEKFGTIVGCPVTSFSKSQFEELEDLGEGNYSLVTKVKFKPTGEIFALKTVDKKKASRLAMRHGNVDGELRTERRVMSKLHHPNIIELYLTFQDANNLYFLSEFANGRELWSLLKISVPSSVFGPQASWPQFDDEKKKQYWSLCGLPRSEVRFYAAQILNAMVYLHSQGVVHRDLKPENILVVDAHGRRLLKLVDFGTCRDLLDRTEEEKFMRGGGKGEESEEILDEETRRRRESFKGKPTHFVGTPEFMSPEAIHGKPADFRADVWSFGCTFYQLLTGRTPFKGASDYLTYLKAESGEYHLPTDYLDEDEVEVLRTTLVVDRRFRRRTMGELRSQLAFFGEDYCRRATEEAILPFPSLEERAVEHVGRTIWLECELRGEGPLAKSYGRSFLSGLNAMWKKRDDSEDYAGVIVLSNGNGGGATGGISVTFPTFDLPSLPRTARGAVRAWLQQRSLLSTPTALRHLYRTPSEARFERIESHQFVGLSQAEEGNFVTPFLIAVVGEEEEARDESAARAVGEKLSAIKPRPRLVITGSKSLAERLTTLAIEMPVAYLPDSSDEKKEPNNNNNSRDGTEDDRRYYSLWVGGILVIVLDTSRVVEGGPGDKAQFDWFERELMLGKMCARNAIVVSRHAWMEATCATPEEASGPASSETARQRMVGKGWRAIFLSQMRESNVSMIVSFLNPGGGSGGDRAFALKRPIGSEATVVRVEQHFAAPLLDDKGKKRLRVIRALTTKLTADLYALDEIPPVFYLAVDDDPRAEYDRKRRARSDADDDDEEGSSEDED